MEEWKEMLLTVVQEALKPVVERLDRIGQRLDRLETEVGEVKQLLDRLETEVGEVKQLLDRLEAEVGEVKQAAFRLEENEPEDIYALLQNIHIKMDSLQSDLEFTYIENSLTKLELERLKRAVQA